MRNKRVAVALSGGVDSAVAAYILCKQGWEVVGVSLHLVDEEDPEGVGYGRCCSAEDLHLARKTTDLLGIPHYFFDRTESFLEEIIQPFVEGYRQGITPNPCVRCNEKIKFSTLFSVGDKLGCTLIATGHYARVTFDAKGIPHLLRGRDNKKDQSYFLFTLSREELKRVLFPVGGLSKDEVRALARAAGLPGSHKPDSQDLCFLAGTDLKSFLIKHGVSEAPGEIVGSNGKVYGTHSGIHLYTIGQRRGLGISSREPLYVKALDPERRQVIVAPRNELYRQHFFVNDTRWIHGKPEGPIEVMVEVRYRTSPRRARVVPLGPYCRVELIEEPAIVTPGQVAVFYREEEVLGGGWITLRDGLDPS